MVTEIRLIIKHTSLTCSAPQVPRFPRQKTTFSCIRFRSFFVFIRFWWSCIFIPRVAMHCSHKIKQWSVNPVYLIVLRPISKVYLMFDLVKFGIVSCVQISCPICSWAITIYRNHWDGHKRLQFLVFNWVYLRMRSKLLDISYKGQHLTSTSR